ncbi:hypothetical protein L9F63_024908, partial [Diploptera punctata]
MAEFDDMTLLDAEAQEHIEDVEIEEDLRDQVNRRRRRRHRRLYFQDIPVYLRDDENPMEKYNDVQFYARYRLTKHVIVFILELIGHRMMTNDRRGLPVPPVIQLLMAIIFYRT